MWESHEKDMKRFLLTLAITSDAFIMDTDNTEIECNMIITMFYFSIEEKRPITDAQLFEGIEACTTLNNIRNL